MPHPNSETSAAWFGLSPRRILLLLGLALASFALVACADDNGDGDDGLDGLNGDSSPTVPTPSTGNGDATTPSPTVTATSPSGGQGGGATGGDTIQVEMIDIDYSENEIMATAGEELTIEFENTGALEHTFTITEIDADVPEEFQTDEYDLDVMLQAGESDTLTFTPNEAGEFEYWCTVPGHREAGMVGTLTVEEGD